MGNTSIELKEIGTHLAELAPLIRAGETITLFDGMRPIAEIRPVDDAPVSRRPFGLARGTFTVPPASAEDDAAVAALFHEAQA